MNSSSSLSGYGNGGASGVVATFAGGATLPGVRVGTLFVGGEAHEIGHFGETGQLGAFRCIVHKA